MSAAMSLVGVVGRLAVMQSLANEQIRFAQAADSPDSPQPPIGGEAAWLAIMLGVLTAVVLVVLGLLIVTMARNVRRTRKPPSPTTYLDVWSMHKLPEQSNEWGRQNDGERP